MAHVNVTFCTFATETELTAMIITDNQFDTVYFSSYFSDIAPQNRLYPLTDIFCNLTEKLKAYNVRIGTIPRKDNYVATGELSIWSRDYMPLQVADRRFVQFTYTPDYLNAKKYLGHVPDTGWINRRIAEKAQKENAADFYLSYSDIVLDGGNVVRCGDYVVMTEKIFEENPEKSPARLLDRLESLFSAEIVLLPWDKRETYGHTDGLLRYVGDNTIIYGTYGLPEKNRTDRWFNESFLRRLKKKFDVRVLDFGCVDKIYPEEQLVDLRWAYMNWLQVGNLIIIPEFKDVPNSNEYARNQIFSVFGELGLKVDIETVEATSLVKLGGCFNCASWTIKRLDR